MPENLLQEWRLFLVQRFRVRVRIHIPSSQWNKVADSQPRSGARMQPTALAVGASGKQASPGGATELSATQDSLQQLDCRELRVFAPMSRKPKTAGTIRSGARTNKSTITGTGIPRQSLQGSPALVCCSATCVLICSFSAAPALSRALRNQTQGEVVMSGQVILYFEDQADALRFALAAGSVMAGDGTRATDDLVQETARVTRIRLEAANKGKHKQPNPPECAA